MKYEIMFYKKDIDNSYGQQLQTIVPSNEEERLIMTDIKFAHSITGNGGGIGHSYPEGVDTPVVFIDENKHPELEKSVVQEQWGLRPDEV
jgi:hypothetical protein